MHSEVPCMMIEFAKAPLSSSFDQASSAASAQSISDFVSCRILAEFAPSLFSFIRSDHPEFQMFRGESCWSALQSVRRARGKEKAVSRPNHLRADISGRLAGSIPRSRKNAAPPTRESSIIEHRLP